jgi:hypothetical protein
VKTLFLLHLVVPFLMTSLNLPLPDSALSSNDSSPEIEEEIAVNDIDMTFSLEGNSIFISGEFSVSGQQECVKTNSFDFEHKKKYTLGVTDLKLEKQGEDWYEANFIIEKYFFAKVKALYHYSIDHQKNQINFYLKKNDINLKSFDIVDTSIGSIRIIAGNGSEIKVRYDLEYRLKPTMMKRSLYKIQKKESVEFLKAYKAYLEENC